jgi:hypothetical protein
MALWATDSGFGPNYNKSQDAWGPYTVLAVPGGLCERLPHGLSDERRSQPR